MRPRGRAAHRKTDNSNEGECNGKLPIPFRLDSTIDALENALDCLEARLQKSIADAEADDDDEVEFESIICKFERKSPTKVRVFDDDGSADFETLVSLVCEMQTKFGLEEAWGCVWTSQLTDMEPTLHGAAVCRHGRDEFMSTEQWLEERLKRP